MKYEIPPPGWGDFWGAKRTQPMFKGVSWVLEAYRKRTGTLSSIFDPYWTPTSFVVRTGSSKGEWRMKNGRP